MKNSIKAKKHHGKSPTPPKPALVPAQRSSRWRWVGLGLCLLVAGAGTWAVLEFVVWNKVLRGELPGELICKWEVVQGPPEFKEAEFQFYRSGKMIGHLNDNGRDRPMNAQVDVEGDKLSITTRHPTTGKELVVMQTIRTLNDRELVLVDNDGKIIKMVRFP